MKTETRTNIEALAVKGREMVATQSSEQIAAAFLLTDELVSDATLLPADRIAVAQAREWMLEELCERDELARVALCRCFCPLDEFGDCPECTRERWGLNED